MYGGDVVCWVVFLVDVLCCVFDVVGCDFVVVCKIGVMEGVCGGGMVDDVCEIVWWFEVEGVYLFVLSGGMNVELVW